MPFPIVDRAEYPGDTSRFLQPGALLTDGRTADLHQQSSSGVDADPAANTENPMATPSSVDPLTLLPRRSNFLLALQLASSEAQEERWPLGLVLVQVDRPGGSQPEPSERRALPTVGKVLRLACGAANLVGHIEDGLFAIMKRDSNCEQTHRTAERCRFAVEHHFANWTHPLTSSVGAACSPMFFAWSSTQLMALASWRSGQARAAGGNAVCSAGFDPRLRQRFGSWPAFRTH